MYRKFWLKNSLGETFEDLKANFQFGEPSGLGMQSSFTTTRLGDSELLLYTEFQLLEKGFELRFYGDNVTAYQKYASFSRFVSKSPLYLYYQPPNLKEPLVCTVECSQIDKGEIGTDGILRTSVSFKPFDFWKDNVEHRITATKTVTVGGKSYPLKRPYYYSVDTLSNISIYNDGINNAPFTIEVNGTVTNLQYNLFTSDGTKYGVGKFNGTFDRIYVNSDDINETIELERNDTELANPYNYQDMSIGELDSVGITFLKLKAGQSLLSFNVDTNFNGTIDIVWSNRYVTI